MTPKRSWRGFVFIGASVDGYIAEPGGGLDWLTDPPPDPGHVLGRQAEDAPEDYRGFIRTVDQLVMGRGTYEKVLTFESWPYEGTPVIVLSTTLEQKPDANVTVAASLPDVLDLLDRRQARGVYVDGGETIQAFLRDDLIDELTISRAPVLLGSGLPLFGFIPRAVRLTHLGTSTSDGGMTSTHYRVVRPPL